MQNKEFPRFRSESKQISKILSTPFKSNAPTEAKPNTAQVSQCQACAGRSHKKIQDEIEVIGYIQQTAQLARDAGGDAWTSSQIHQLLSRGQLIVSTSSLSGKCSSNFGTMLG